MGVRRAVEMADAAISTAATETDVSAEGSLPQGRLPIYTLGPLIHNPHALASLSRRGIKILNESALSTDSPCAESLAGAVVIIRAHGTSPATENLLRELNVNIIDATCPRVKESQNTAFTLAKKGYTVFIAGEKDHAEVKGIYGYVMAASKIPCVIAGNPEEAGQEARELKQRSGQSDNETIPVKTALIGQTTISADEYFAIAEAIKLHFPDLEIKNTICGATKARQKALKELCSLVNTVIIAGGKDSANTRRLLAIAKSCGIPAWLVENASEIPELLLQLPETTETITIGLSAGASTPDSVIDEIEHALL